MSPAIKSLNYLPNIMARAEAVRAGAQEAILLSQQGYVSECTGDNIFYVQDGNLYTPPTYAGILDGITRGAVIDIAREKMGLKVEEKLFTVHELYRAAEAFVTGTGAEVVAAVKIDGHPIGSGVPGPLTKKIAQAFQDYARSHGTPIYEEVKAR